jgi:arylacetamide deacetylase-like 3/4
MAVRHPFPQPTEDCYRVVRYVMDNASKFNADGDRIVLAGDSAGGNAVAVITQRLRKENLKQPKLQLLIYPWCQLMCDKLPSATRYAKTGVLASSGITMAKACCWYLGFKHVNKDLQSVYTNNEIIGLVENEKDQKRIISYLDTSKIPEKYKKGKSYYETAASEMKFTLKLPETSLLRRNEHLSRLLRNTLEPSCSPLFAHRKDLVDLPKAYFLILEWDTLKDEGLLYAQRLKEAGVEVEIDFYEKAFHGIAIMVKRPFSYKIAKDMQTNLIRYLEKNL